MPGRIVPAYQHMEYGVPSDLACLALAMACGVRRAWAAR